MAFKSFFMCSFAKTKKVKIYIDENQHCRNSEFQKTEVM